MTAVGQKTRSAVTLSVLGVLLVVAAAWGWQAMTSPLPETAPAPVCVETEVSAGQQVFTGQVVVSVFNASGRSGQASRVMNRLIARGFVPARTGNAPDDTSFRGVRVYGADPENPAVALVAAQFRRSKVVEGPALGPGVVVVIGNRPGKLVGKKKVRSLNSAVDATVCSPPGSFD